MAIKKITFFLLIDSFFVRIYSFVPTNVLSYLVLHIFTGEGNNNRDDGNGRRMKDKSRRVVGRKCTAYYYCLLVLRLLGLKFVTLMMVMRLIVKTVAPVTPVTEPVVVVPGMISVLVVVSSSILVVLSSKLVVVIVVPLPVEIVVSATSVCAVHLLMHLEWVLLVLLPLLLLLMMEVRFDLLRPTPIHFSVAIVFVLPLPVFPPFIRQFAVHIGLLTVPATNRCSVTTMRELVELIDDVVSVAVAVTVTVTVVTVVTVIILPIVWLVAGCQWTTASAIAVHVAIVGGGGITGSGR